MQVFTVTQCKGFENLCTECVSTVQKLVVFDLQLFQALHMVWYDRVGIIPVSQGGTAILETVFETLSGFYATGSQLSQCLESQRTEQKYFVTGFVKSRKINNQFFV